jgi:hypothetical protein
VLPGVQTPTMGIWSSGDMALTKTQMTDSAENVAGPWRYERIDGPGHWGGAVGCGSSDTQITRFQMTAGVTCITGRNTSRPGCDPP